MLEDHPAGVGDRRFWFGIEAEGQHRGKRVAVIRAKPDTSDKFYVEVFNREVEHFFLTEDFDDWDWVCSDLVRLADDLHATITAGCEPAKIPDVLKLPCASRIGIIARVWIDDFSWYKQLRPTDEFSVGEAFFMGTSRAGNTVLTLPEDYKGDTK